MSQAVTAGIPYTVDTGEKPVNETFGPGTSAGAEPARRSSGRCRSATDGRSPAPSRSTGTASRSCEHPTAVADFFDSGAVEVGLLPGGRAAGDRRCPAPRAWSCSITRCARATRPSARRGSCASRCCRRTTTTPSGPGRSACARSCPTRRMRCSRSASRSSRCGARSTSRSGPTRSRSPTRAASPSTDLLAAERRYPHRVGRDLPGALQPRTPLVLLPARCGATRRSSSRSTTRRRTAGRASRRTPRSSIPTTPPNAPPRQSIEARTFAFFAV